MTKHRRARTRTTGSRQLRRFCADESGATAIEYAMIASGIGAAVAATVYSLGSTRQDDCSTTSSPRILP